MENENTVHHIAPDSGTTSPASCPANENSLSIGSPRKSAGHLDAAHTRTSTDSQDVENALPDIPTASDTVDHDTNSVVSTPPPKHEQQIVEQNPLPPLPANRTSSLDSRPESRLQSPSPSVTSGSASLTHKRSTTVSKGHNVSVVLITSALEVIASSKEAKRSVPLRESTQKALDLIHSNQAGEQPREIFEPLRLACETRNEKLMIASLDCISKLVSYSFFEDDGTSVHGLPSPPPSPGPQLGKAPGSAPLPSLVDLVAHTITSCHSEGTTDAVSLQIVKALLALVLSHTILVHHSSLLKAVRTVYNIFLLSTDPVNQMVAQGGLTQMVHHIFSRCPRSGNPHQVSETVELGGHLPTRLSFVETGSDTDAAPLTNEHFNGVSHTVVSDSTSPDGGALQNGPLEPSYMYVWFWNY